MPAYWRRRSIRRYESDRTAGSLGVNVPTRAADLCGRQDPSMCPVKISERFPLGRVCLELQTFRLFCAGSFRRQRKRGQDREVVGWEDAVALERDAFELLLPPLRRQHQNKVHLETFDEVLISSVCRFDALLDAGGAASLLVGALCLQGDRREGSCGPTSKAFADGLSGPSVAVRYPVA